MKSERGETTVVFPVHKVREESLNAPKSLIIRDCSPFQSLFVLDPPIPPTGARNRPNTQATERVAEDSGMAIQPVGSNQTYHDAILESCMHGRKPASTASVIC